MSSRRRHFHGFTLIEAIIALCVGGLVLVVVMQLSTWAATSFHRTEERLDPRETTHQALTLVRERLQDAWSYQVSADGAELAFSGPQHGGLLRWDAGAHTLWLTAGHHAPAPLLTGLVSCKLQEARPGYLRVMVEVARPRPAGKLAALPSAVMFEDVWVPAVGARAGAGARLRHRAPRPQARQHPGHRHR